ncbi:uncharacterized protein LOC122381337 isoform X2 [Amphibalanus amphitrite]|uniref:uncharacterized protein LOC122381337 isoform X2 n=1 Tax=Amphibalanus amphitrite TaxID=1232801 RepID=UPI001C90C23D|nr:uncharacterized protein LOC122381337 isoform X2 [Amphibalanus amphitrite]
MRACGGLLALLWVLQGTAIAAGSGGDAFVAKCRAQCSRKLTSDGSKASCLKQEECLRCWASCQAFQRDHYIREYCKLNKACSAGCRQACDFYLTSASVTTELNPAVQTSTEAAPEATTTVSGPKVTSPASADSAQESLLYGPPPSFPSEPHKKTSSSGLQDHKARWRPLLSSIEPGSPLVSATLTWRARGQDASYLVTWELRSGGLRGHLVSEEPRVSLSLWPDEDYVVQVFNGDDASEPLFVSTKTPLPAEKLAAPSAATLAVGAVGLACLAAAVVGCCALACHERRRRSAEYLLPLEEGRRECRVRNLLARNRTVDGVLRPPGKAVAAARMAPLFVISHARR